MFNKIILAGGSGYLGNVLANYFKDKADEILILSRSEHASQQNIHYVKWDGRTAGDWVDQLEGADLLINLSGKNVNCRYTEKNKQEIFSSRLEPTTLLGQVLARLANPAKIWINLASSTIYRHAEDHYQDEATGEIGSGFSIDVCKAWEKTFWETSTPQTKKILLRVGIVLGRKDGMLPRVINLVKMGMGGHQGMGRQYISWIHEQDLARITEWVFENGRDGEIYNCTSPNAIQNKDFMRIARNAIGIPIGLPTPQWMLEFGAGIIGTETELILKSRWVYPKNLLEKGFQFQFPLLDHAMHDLLSTRV